jgi:hypothetical protein
MTVTRRLPARHDDRGSLAMAMLAILVGAMLGALIVPIVLAQNDSTRFDMSRVRALHAAQSGVDVMLGEIRTRSGSRGKDGVLTGDPKNLPCYTGKAGAGPLSGNANGTGTASYTVTVSYYTDRPVTGAKPMICLPLYGTYDPVKQTATPRFAVITSKGTDQSDQGADRVRTVVSTYVFRTSDTNIPGGQIRLFPGGDPADAVGKWCMEAGEPVKDAIRVVLGLCSSSTPPKASQMFAYRDDLSIQLVSSVGRDGHPSGLCIDTQDSVNHKAGDGIVLKDCAVANTADCHDEGGCSSFNQQWSVDDNAHLRGASASGKNTDNFCIDAASQGPAGMQLTLRDCSGGITDPHQTWVPSPTAGAGMAGPKNDQLVNYREFATCLDVTGQAKDAEYLILYSCKQNPDPAKVLWNQKFTPSPPVADVKPDSELRLLITRPPGSKDYCLTSPQKPGGFVRTTPCPGSALEGSIYSWTVNRVLLDDKFELPYARKFTIVDAQGLCLSPGPTTNKYYQYLKVTVEVCDGSTGQKWNADPSLDAAKLTNTHEASGP